MYCTLAKYGGDMDKAGVFLQQGLEIMPTAAVDASATAGSAVAAGAAGQAASRCTAVELTAAARKLVKTATREAVAVGIAAENAAAAAATAAPENVEEAAGGVAGPTMASTAALAKGEQATEGAQDNMSEVAKAVAEVQAREEAASAMAKAAGTDAAAAEFRKKLAPALQNLEASNGGPLERQMEGEVSITVEFEDAQGETRKETMTVPSRQWSAEEGEEFTKAMHLERLNQKFFFPNVAKVNFNCCWSFWNDLAFNSLERVWCVRPTRKHKGDARSPTCF